MRTSGREEAILGKAQTGSGQTGFPWVKTAPPSITLLRTPRWCEHPTGVSVVLCGPVSVMTANIQGFLLSATLACPDTAEWRCPVQTPAVAVSHCVTVYVVGCIWQKLWASAKVRYLLPSKVTFITVYHCAWYNVKDWVECVEMVSRWCHCRVTKSNAAGFFSLFFLFRFVFKPIYVLSCFQVIFFLISWSALRLSGRLAVFSDCCVQQQGSSTTIRCRLTGEQEGTVPRYGVGVSDFVVGNRIGVHQRHWMLGLGSETWHCETKKKLEAKRSWFNTSEVVFVLTAPVYVLKLSGVGDWESRGECDGVDESFNLERKVQVKEIILIKYILFDLGIFGPHY